MTAVADLRFLAVSATAGRIARIGVPLKTSLDDARATRDGDDGARDMASVATRARCATIKVREFAPRELGRTRRGRARRRRATTFWISV